MEDFEPLPRAIVTFGAAASAAERTNLVEESSTLHFRQIPMPRARLLEAHAQGLPRDVLTAACDFEARALDDPGPTRLVFLEHKKEHSEYSKRIQSYRVVSATAGAPMMVSPTSIGRSQARKFGKARATAKSTANKCFIGVGLVVSLQEMRENFSRQLRRTHTSSNTIQTPISDIHDM